MKCECVKAGIEEFEFTDLNPILCVDLDAAFLLKYEESPDTSCAFAINLSLSYI